MTALDVFKYDQREVRVVLRDGEPWFVAADAAAILGYAGGARNAIARLPERMKGVEDVNTPGGRQRMVVLSEAGVNRLIMRAETEQAERVQDWLAEVVMPSIRRTGTYEAPAARPVDVASIDRRTLAVWLIEAEDARSVAEARVAELEPAADAWAQMVEGGGDLSLTAAAKALQSTGLRVKPKDFYLYLHEKRWTYRAGGVGDWTPYADAVERGWLTTRLVTDHEGKVKPQVRVTVEGMEKLRTMLIADRGDPGMQAQTSLQLVVAR